MAAVLIALLLLVTTAVDAAPRRRAVGVTPQPAPQSFTFDFARGTEGWEAGYSDYSLNTADMKVVNELRVLPAEIGSTTAWYLSGWNYADDLFLFLKRKLTVVPNQSYVVRYTVTFATNAGRTCIGIGGAPGESVVIKLGASPVEPVPTLFDTYIAVPVDKGNQAQSGVHASAAGTISGETSCGSDAPYVTVVRSHTHAHAVPSSSSGELWLLFGIDSGFEGFNTIYVQRIEVTIEPVPASDPRARWQTTYASIADTVADLTRAGFKVRVHPYAGVPTEHLLNAREIHYPIESEPANPQEIVFFVFDDGDDVERAQAMISPDGSRLGDLTVHWIAPPHFFRGDHLIAAYLGSSPTALSILRQRFGEQFAGR